MHKVYVEDYGCWLNKALAAYIRQLVAREAVIVERAEEADAVIVNTCAVRAESERKVLARLRELARMGKRVAVTGCLVNVRPYSIVEAAPGASLIEPSCLDEIEKFLRGEDVWCVREYRRAAFAARYNGGVRFAVPIQVGCTGSCSFCVEPIVRRGVASLEPDRVVELVADAVRRGAKEVYLTGQDVAAYGVDLGTRLTDLLQRILSEVDGEYRLRLGMMEPWMVSRLARDLAALMRDRRVYKYLHLPLQSGDDGVLKLMKRKYTVSEYEQLVSFFRREVGELSVVTDMIVGFPGETQEAFMRSVEAVRRLRFDKVHVARYTFRPFTPAYVAGNTVPEPEKKRRSRVLSQVALRVAAEVNSSYVGRELYALVCERGEREGTLVARTDAYKPVVVPEGAKLGEWVKVRIRGFTPLHLIGEVVD